MVLSISRNLAAVERTPIQIVQASGVSAVFKILFFFGLSAKKLRIGPAKVAL